MLKSNLDNGYTLYIKIATAPIKENIKISNETLALIGVLMVMISAILSSFVSKKIYWTNIRIKRYYQKNG